MRNRFFCCEHLAPKHIFWSNRLFFTMLQGSVSLKFHGPIPPTAVVPDIGQHINHGPTLKKYVSSFFMFFNIWHRYGHIGKSVSSINIHTLGPSQGYTFQIPIQRFKQSLQNTVLLIRTDLEVLVNQNPA